MMRLTPSSGRGLKLTPDIRCVLIILEKSGMSIILILSNVMHRTLFFHYCPTKLALAKRFAF